MNNKLPSILKSCVFFIVVLMSVNVNAQYYVVYPASNKNPNCVYCYQLHDTLSRTHEGGSFSIETYYMSLTCPCSSACVKCADPWQCDLNDNLYSNVSYYDDNEDETYNEDGRTADDTTGDLQINGDS